MYAKQTSGQETEANTENQPQGRRKMAVARLRWVIRRIDVLVKGGDYRSDEVVGREEVEAAGGKLCLFPFRSSYSTSALIARIGRSQ